MISDKVPDLSRPGIHSGEILFKDISLKDYACHFDGLEKTTLLQAPLYAAYARQAYQQTSSCVLVEINGHPAGLCLLQEAAILGKLIHAVILDRGPLWFKGFGSSNHLEMFFRHFNKKYPNRAGRRRRLIPEAENTPAVTSALRNAGLVKNRKYPGYQTIWLDLRPTQDTLRRDLRGKWRNCLRKAEKRGVEVDFYTNVQTAAWILSAHARDRAAKGYQGPSIKNLGRICHIAAASNDLVCAVAKDQGKIVAGQIFLRHGKSATYQVGWTDTPGRDLNAGYAIMWQSLSYLKSGNINFLDLGGVNDKDAAGVKHFKSGLGGDFLELSGQYK